MPLRYLLTMETGSQEHGIAVVQLIAAEQRQREGDGIYRQHRWAVAHLDGRIFGLFVLVVMVLSILVALIVSPWIGAAIGAAFLIVLAALRARRRRCLAAIREAQVAAYRSGASARK